MTEKLEASLNFSKTDYTVAKIDSPAEVTISYFISETDYSPNCFIFLQMRYMYACMIS